MPEDLRFVQIVQRNIWCNSAFNSAGAKRYLCGAAKVALAVRDKLTACVTARYHMTRLYSRCTANERKCGCRFDLKRTRIARK